MNEGFKDWGETYFLKHLTKDMFGNIPGFTDTTGNGNNTAVVANNIGAVEATQELVLVTDGELVINEDVTNGISSGSIDISHHFAKEHDFSHTDMAEIVGEVAFYMNARYIPPLNTWYLWDGIYWGADLLHLNKTITVAILKNLASVLVEQAKSRADINDKELEEYIDSAKKQAKTLKSNTYRKHISETLEIDSNCTALPVILDQNKELLGTPDGTISTHVKLI